MSDEAESEEEHEQRVRLLAARRAQDIVRREGTALALSARDLDEDAIAADSHLLAIAIAQAIVDAYAGDILGEDRDE